MVCGVILLKSQPREDEHTHTHISFSLITLFNGASESRERLAPNSVEDLDSKHSVSKSGLMDVFVSLQLRLSSISVVLDFNASLNDFVPVFPMLLPVDVMERKRVDC